MQTLTRNEKYYKPRKNFQNVVFTQIASTRSDLNCITVGKYAQEEKIMERKYTAIVRKSKLEYVAVCLELNVTARGDDLADVEKNLRTAIELYLEDIKKHPETVSSPISTEEFIEFQRDTDGKEKSRSCILQTGFKAIEIYR